MNGKINKYINYLTENNPSPFCDYIISRELDKRMGQRQLGLGKAVRDENAGRTGLCFLDKIGSANARIFAFRRIHGGKSSPAFIFLRADCQ